MSKHGRRMELACTLSVTLFPEKTTATVFSLYIYICFEEREGRDKKKWRKYNSVGKLPAE